MHGIESSPSALVSCSRSWAPPVSAGHASRPSSSARSATHSSSAAGACPTARASRIGRSSRSSSSFPKSRASRAELLARIVHQRVLSYTSPESFTRVGQLAEQAIPVFEAAGDDRGLMEGWLTIGETEHGLCRFRRRNEAFLRAIEHARRCGHEHPVRHLPALLGPGYVFGPAPVEEGLAWHSTGEAEDVTDPGLLGAGRCSRRCEGIRRGAEAPRRDAHTGSGARERDCRWTSG
jgi:hypothetical protein